jgi:hypothetical protein
LAVDNNNLVGLARLALNLATPLLQALHFVETGDDEGEFHEFQGSFIRGHMFPGFE